MLGLGCLFVGLTAVAAQTPKKDDVPKYIKNLTAKDVNERLAAVDALAKIGELKKVYAKDAWEPLCNVVRKDDDAKVRAAAAQALGRIDADPEKATPALMEGLKDKERAVQIASALGLGALGAGARDAVPALKDMVEKAKAEVAAAKDEVAKFKDDKEKEKVARGKLQAAQQLLQAANNSLRAVAGN